MIAVAGIKTVSFSSYCDTADRLRHSVNSISLHSSPLNFNNLYLIQTTHLLFVSLLQENRAQFFLMRVLLCLCSPLGGKMSPTRGGCFKNGRDQG